MALTNKEYNELKGELFFKDTPLPEMQRLGRCKLQVDISTLLIVDSLCMAETDRKNILENCKKIKENKILITHCTNTMVETAKVLANAINNKMITLTGAMVLYKFGISDGLFNVGSSLTFV